MSREERKRQTRAQARAAQAQAIPKVGRPEEELILRAQEALGQYEITEHDPTEESDAPKFGKPQRDQTANESERASSVVTGGPGLHNAEIERVVDHKLRGFSLWALGGALTALLILGGTIGWLVTWADTRTNTAKDELHAEIVELRGEVQRGNDQIRSQLDRLDDRLRASETNRRP